MFVNPAYNNARPCFINFRPILHNTRRLSDEELDKYNSYNEIVEDLEYQVDQLELEKVDTFDLKMELKLVKDKVMAGNFTIVEIYLEGLRPRVEKQWEKLGKKPKKREIQLVAESEIKASIEEAKKDRAKWEKTMAKPAEKEEKKEENINEKIVNPLTFDNGIMVSSLKELKSVLPNLDNEIFKLHVNKKKNEISDWIRKQISQELGEKLKEFTDKNSVLKEIENFGKPNKNIKKIEEKKVEQKAEEVKQVQGKTEETASKVEETKEAEKITEQKISKKEKAKKEIGKKEVVEKKLELTKEIQAEVAKKVNEKPVKEQNFKIEKEQEKPEIGILKSEYDKKQVKKIKEIDKLTKNITKPAKQIKVNTKKNLNKIKNLKKDGK